MNIKKDIPLYVLAASLLLSSVIYASANKSTNAGESVSPSYVTEEKFSTTTKALVTEVISLTNQVKNLKNCVTNISISLNDTNGSMRVPFC